MTRVTPSLTIPDDSTRASALFMIVLRLVFVLVLVAVGWSLASDERYVSENKDLVIIGFAGVALVFIAMDVFVPRKSLSAISGLFFGLVVGMVVAYGLSLIIDLLVEANIAGGGLLDSSAPLVSAIKLAIGVICCYLAVSFILQTKDDVRFVIPYVQFAKETKGSRPVVLDTSVIVDGRIADIANTSI
ncbi:MAG: hypothetical protein IID38_11780, partial [Planctomycetes bacterium]|nr:hypothetical protein [Planctomycetota bacterium]